MAIARRIFFRSDTAVALTAFAAAAFISVVAYPEVFTAFKTSFVVWYDYCVDYPLTFILTNFFYQGGLQLWNVFAQMPFVHSYGVEGLFKLPNVVTALSYYALHPLADDAARLYHHVFAWSNLLTLLFVRVAGIYLLLKTVTQDRRTLFIATVLLAVFTSQFAFLRGQFYMSCFPLGMYFIVRFFQTLQWSYGLATVFFFIVCLGSGVLHGAYMYLPLHFFILAGIIWRVFIYGRPQAAAGATARQPVPWAKIIGVLLAAVLVLAPYAYIVKVGFKDIAFDQANSRIGHMFDLQWYFKTTEMDTRLFFKNVLNTHAAMDTYSIYYIGWTFVAFALIGAVFSPNRLKWFFMLSFLLLWLLGQPRDQLGPGLLAHWINALTNPLNTIPRSYQNACQPMVPCLFMPLVVLGVEVIRARLPGGKVLRTGAMLVLFCLIAVDIFWTIAQAKREFKERCARPTVLLDAAPKTGEVAVDYANPSIFPFRNSYTFHFSYKDEMYLWFPQGASSVMRHVVNQGLNYTFLNGYNPRHVEMAKWLQDPPMMYYLESGSEFIFLADMAIQATPDAMPRILQAGLSRRVAMVDDAGGALKLPTLWPPEMAPVKSVEIRYDEVTAALEPGRCRPDRQHDGMILCSFKLPDGFPDQLSTSVFPAEQPYMRLMVDADGKQWRELTHAEGELIRPYTFDVHNIQAGVLTIALPAADAPQIRRYHLLFRSASNEGVQGIWRKQFDNLGITFQAHKDGWLVTHYPYDTKFRVSVDGTEVPYYRTNKSFIGFQLPKGVHKILIQYWPGSWLGPALLVSALITTVGFLAIIFLGLRWEGRR